MRPRHLWFLLMIAAFVVLFPLACEPEYQHVPPHLRFELTQLRGHLDDVVAALRAFEKEHGRFPGNDEGLGVLPPFPDEVRVESDEDSLFAQGFCCGWIVRLPVRSEAGVLSYYLVPILYENRRDAPPGAFDDSPVNEDGGHRWSAQVAEGILVWDPAGRSIARELSSLEVRRDLAVLGPLLAFLLFGGLWIHANLRDRSRGRIGRGPLAVLRAVLGVLLALGALVSPLSQTMVTCYKMMNFPLFRRDRFAAECEQILSDYRDRGVIRPETCRRLVDAIRADGETLRKLER